MEPDDVLGLLGCGYAPHAPSDGGHCPAPPQLQGVRARGRRPCPLKTVRTGADNLSVERRFPTASLLLAVALAFVLTAAPAVGGRPSSLEAGIVRQLNAVREAQSLRPLRLNNELENAARAHSLEMTSFGYFAHHSADGGSFAGRVRQWYALGPRGSAGENLLWVTPQIGATRVVQLWLASPEHRANILDPSWQDVGCSALHADSAPGVFADEPVTVVTCDFGTRS